jgi:hypothetical protein
MAAFMVAAARPVASRKWLSGQLLTQQSGGGGGGSCDGDGACGISGSHGAVAHGEAHVEAHVEAVARVVVAHMAAVTHLAAEACAAVVARMGTVAH